MREHFFVEAGEHGLSLLQFLKGQLAYSGKTIKRVIDSNGCFINGKVERFSSSRVRQGDLIAIAMERSRYPQKRHFSLLYEDETLRAVNKHPFVACNKSHTLHRLDKETSGVLLTSDDPAYFDLFYERKMKKKYLAVVCGKLSSKKGVINQPIGVKKQYDGHKVMHVTQQGKEALTRYEVMRELKDLSVLALYPKTGRTHQIRVHLAWLGHPILGDYDYGGHFPVVPPRMLLHAHKISFQHPHKQEPLTIEAPIPEDFMPYL